MKNKDRKYVIVSDRLHPSQVNELSMCCFIIDSNKLDDILSFILNNGWRVMAAVPGSGLSRYSFLEKVGGFEFDKYVVFAVCQKEITDIFMLNICKEFKFNKKGKGKAFVVDVLGYMGAKGPFVE